MLEFKVKTRGDSSPQGKQRVYFCAHPEDHKRYFEHTCELILEKQNCAFYYDENPAAEVDKAELFSLLSEIQLFVIPVSVEFLTKPSRARDVELAYAMEKHIPVLPLMQDSGIDELFSRVFGNMQYLDEHNRDSTAISFDEKLEKFLGSVLVGDELAEKVRKAFDAYIFLSYRKKDRIYAQQLMRLIHENDFCRDIAIWYDEFLTPGEDFNKAIEAALDHSKLFALAVTPNLINEENYVKNIEFPIARDSEKPMLPAEMVETDRKELAEKFKNIGEVTDSRDREALGSALFKKLEGIAKMENDNDPEHNFFIGLAYLKGIDVEVDFERALKLITGAAEAELPEALEKLVEMYRTGTGVERDYLKAISWQEKLVEVRKKLYEGVQTEENSTALFVAMCDLGDYLKELAKLEKAKEVYLECLNFARAVEEKAKTAESRRNLSVSYNRLGDVYVSEDRFDEAKEMYLKFFEIGKALAEETKTVESRRILSASYDRLGDIYKAEDMLEKAKEMYLQSFEISKALAEETKTVESCRDLSVSYDKLGGIYKAEGKHKEAKEMYLQSFEISKSLAEETKTAESCRHLSISYSRLGDIYKAEGKLEKAKEMYLQCFEIDKALAEETKTMESRRDLSVSCVSLGGIYKSEGNLEKAKEMYLQFFEISKALAKETKTVGPRRELSVSYDRLGGIYQAEGKLEEAKEMYLQGFEIRKALAEETKTIESRRDLSVSCNKLGDIYQAEGKLEEAKEMHLQCFEISKALAEETKTVGSRRDLSISCNKLGDIYESEGKLEKAKEMYLQGFEIFKALAEETRTINSQRDLSASYDRLGDIYESEGKLGEAKEMYLQAFEIDKALVEETNMIQEYDALAASYVRLTLVSKNNEEYLQAAYDIWSALATQCPDTMKYAQRRDFVKSELDSLAKKS